ncbi:hypothetical protein K492DRAFT_193648 [Lichtheimia hyalospora FSU 10163]|nr:hypothetical protein K492DRAFT_193648 [Lichtheimia hyalospora FSU 10163]
MELWKRENVSPQGGQEISGEKKTIINYNITIMHNTVGHFFRKSIFKPEVAPLIAILGTALGGAVFIGLKQSRAPDVCWDHKHNPYPWQEIKDGEQVKLMALNQKYDSRWERSKW